MKVLVVGDGGGEHVICRKLRESGRSSKPYCAPGNTGIAEVAGLVSVDAMEFEKIWGFALRERIDLVVIGMDDPPISGFADFLGEAGLKVSGPKKNVAILKDSKVFAKELMKKYEVPTAAYESFTGYEAAKRYLETCKVPVVLKVDGLALGKDVLICETREAAEGGLKEMMLERKFGVSGDRAVTEEFMTDRKIPMFSFVDGKTIYIVASVQDYKKAKSGDQGLDTGGTRNYSPNPYHTDEIVRFCEGKIYQHTVDAMAAGGRPLQGIIFFGLMLTSGDPHVFEYNMRSNDPEAQVVLPRMESDLLEVMLVCVEGKLDKVQFKFCNKTCVTVVLTSEGYPMKYEKGLPVSGLESPKSEPDAYRYHADARFNDEGHIVTNGGRVLDVTVLGKTMRETKERAYTAAEKISSANKYMRTDITLADVTVEETQQA